MAGGWGETEVLNQFSSHGTVDGDCAALWRGGGAGAGGEEDVRDEEGGGGSCESRGDKESIGWLFATGREGQGEDELEPREGARVDADMHRQCCASLATLALCVEE